ncbi:hypothetical protein CBS101457_004543 [Exobasidium rhododendri]|nr:hypothetical protein CBS101457_004543 [Exobasidium rhododendri]
MSEDGFVESTERADDQLASAPETAAAEEESRNLNGIEGEAKEETEPETATFQDNYTPVFTLQGHKRSVSSLSISPDGLQLASGGSDGLLKLWALATGALIATLDAAIHATEEDDVAHLRLGISDVVWSKDGQYLVCGGDDCIVRVWDATRHTLARQFSGHTSFVFCVNFHPNVSLAVSGSFDETVRIWNLQKDTCHRTIAAHSEAVTGLDFNRDGSILASCSYDGLIRLWDSSNGQCMKTLDGRGDSSPIGNVLFSPNSFQLLAPSLDNTIRLWDIANSRIVKTYLGHQNEKFAIKACFSAFQKRKQKKKKKSATRSDLQSGGERASLLPPVMVVAGSEDSRIYLWDLQTKKILQTLVGHKDAILAIATHPALSLIASASLDHDPCIKVSVSSVTNTATQAAWLTVIIFTCRLYHRIFQGMEASKSS